MRCGMFALAVSSLWPDLGYGPALLCARFGRTLPTGGVVKNRAIIAAVALVVVFLAGFIPQYVKANRLDTELRQARQANLSAELRDLVGLAYVQANQKNYGLAAASMTRFFNRVRDVSNQTADPNGRKGLENLLVTRDKVTAALAKGDAAVMGDLQELFMKTRQATGRSGEQ
jgi:hypothetical protein